MAIDRTAFNALVDDDGTNTTGSLWDKQAIEDVLLDPIDAAIVAVVPAAWTDVAYASGNFTGGAGTWTVDSGDQSAFKYLKTGRLVTVIITLNTTSIAGTVNPAVITTPVTFVGTTTGLGVLYDNSATVQTVCVWVTSGATLNVYKLDQTAWAASTNNTYLRLIVTAPW